MFELKLDNAKHWRDCVEAIVNLVDEGIFSISKEGITLKAMDPSGISMISFFMPSNSFSKFEIEKTTDIGLNIDNLSKIMSRTRESEALVIKDIDGKLSLEFVGDKNRRRYRLHLIDVRKKEDKEPKVEFDANVELDGEHLKNALKDASLISSYIAFKAGKSNFTISAKGDSGELEELNEVDGVGIRKLDATKDAEAVFNLEFLENMVKSSPMGNIISLGIKSDQPLRLSYKIGEAAVTYYLAPYVEE
jgi:proliferating cell nuclear antigen